MTCPFAKFASMLPPLNPTKVADFHRHHPSSSPPHSSTSTSTTLSEALRIGTSTSHRAVERSLGVSLLLSSSTSTTSSVHFSRLDYVRFQLMLMCIYTTLECGLVRSRASLEPLFEGGLMRELARSGVVWEDVRSHLDTIEEFEGAELAELAEQVREEYGREDIGARDKLLHSVQENLPLATSLTGCSFELTHDHLALLTPSQISSTLTYVSRLNTATPSQLLAHAYTRYLGDLSGGQHIVRKVSKRFPCDGGKGFEFYHFVGKELKGRFRSAMESCNVTDRDEVVREANNAFDLNTVLFESLLPEELRMSVQQQEAVVVRTKQDKWKADSLVVGIFVAVSLVYAFNLVAASRHAVGVHV